MFASDKLDTKCTQIKAEVLLSEPSSVCDGIEDNERLERASCSYSNHSERFRLNKKEFRKQYAQLYAVRLMTMRKKLAAAARRKWGTLILLEYSYQYFFSFKWSMFSLLFRKLIAYQEVIRAET
jgi:DNA polymerase delta subunit 2